MTVLAAGMLSSLGCSGVDGVADETGVVSEAVNVPSAVANMAASGLVESTGNLYWTRNTYSAATFRWTGRVYRAAKTNVPGQETVLYSESGLLGASFGNITFANYGGVWYGYFLATYKSSGTYIKRVPLDGSSPAITFVAAPSASPGSALQCDGTYLYYSGPNGLYSAPLDGGPTRTVTQTAGITSFGFDHAHVYFATGNQIYWAYKPSYGSNSGLLVSVGESITSISVNAGAANDDRATTIAIGTTNTVSLRTYAGVTTLATNQGTYTKPQVGSVSSVPLPSGATRVMWTWCDSYATCWAAYTDSTFQGTWYLSTLAQSGARSIMGDTSQMFFIDDYALERLSY